MLIQTTRFGEVEIQDQDILTFPSGKLGFSAERHFVMIEDEMGSPFHWLQSVEKKDLAFITLNPETAVSDFSLDITVDHMKRLDTDKVEDLSVRGIVTMAKKLQDVTINLQGPLLINARSDHACGTMSIGTKSIIVAAGGDNSQPGYLASVEILDPLSNQWVAGKFFVVPSQIYF